MPRPRGPLQSLVDQQAVLDRLPDHVDILAGAPGADEVIRASRRDPEAARRARVRAATRRTHLRDLANDPEIEAVLIRRGRLRPDWRTARTRRRSDQPEC